MNLLQVMHHSALTKKKQENTRMIPGLSSLTGVHE